MADQIPADRLQPSLLQRLRDDRRESEQEPIENRALSKRQLRDDVLENLRWLMNATRLGATVDLGEFPEVDSSVLNFGLPSLSGETASSINVRELEGAIHEAILRFEPRVLPSSLEVTTDTGNSVMDSHNVISVRIHAQVWAQPVPLELLLKAEVDLETGLVTPVELPH